MFFLVFLYGHEVFRWLEKITARSCGDLLSRCAELELPYKKFQLYIQVWMVVLPVIIFQIAFGMQQIPFSIVMGIVGVMCPRLLLQYLIDRQEKIIRTQMVTASNFLLNTANAGMTITDGFRYVKNELPQPIGKVFGRMFADHQYGRVLNDSIEETKQRLSLESFTLFATALQVAMKRGGSLKDPLGRIAYSLEEHSRLEGKMLSDTAEIRRSNLVLAGFPLLWFFVAPMFQEDFGILFDNIYGQALVAGVILLVFFGFRAANNVLDLEI